MIKSWKSSVDGVSFKELKHRPCTDDDFFKREEGDTNESIYGFYKLSEGTEAVLKDGYNLKCIDEDLSIYGDFNTYTASNLMVTFERCNPKERTCKSKEEIDAYL